MGGWRPVGAGDGDGRQPPQQHAVDQGFVPIGGVVERDQIDHGQLVRLVRAELVPQHLASMPADGAILADHVVGFEPAVCRFRSADVCSRH